jgi:hypothetical protein
LPHLPRNLADLALPSRFGKRFNLPITKLICQNARDIPIIPRIMQDGLVRYVFQLPGEALTFEIDTTGAVPQTRIDYPEWTRLAHQQCACCPLHADQAMYCPAATRVHHLLEAFAHKTSIERVQVLVQTAQRTYQGDVDLQVGVNSLLGLLMATSGCPVLDPLKSMAQFHLPFSTTEETLSRTLGAYLTEQYCIAQKGGDPDWALDGLRALYKRLETLNQDFSKRIQGRVQGDAMANAIILFFATSVLVNASLEEKLAAKVTRGTGKAGDRRG